jgi:hypothetical protein
MGSTLVFGELSKLEAKQNQDANEEVAKTVQIVRRAIDEAGNAEFVKHTICDLGE